MEFAFDFHRYSEEKKAKLVVVEFTDYKISWWDQLVTSRRRNEERLIETWDKIKTILRKRFVSTHYYREIYNKLKTLS